jgi:hypothetical protein
MKKMILLLAILSLSSVAFAAGNKNDLAYIGYNELKTVTSLTTADEVVVFENDVPKKGTTIADLIALDIYAKSDIGTTDETLVVADSGKIFVCNEACTKILPTAAENLIYSFVAGAGVEINVDTGVTTDTIMYLTMSAGDKLTSTGATADSVTLLGDTGKWYVVNMKGTWTDGN